MKPIREKISSDTVAIVENQIKNLVRDFRNVDTDTIKCNISFGGSSVNSTIIGSSIDNLDSNEIITQDQIDLLSKNNPKNNIKDKAIERCTVLDSDFNISSIRINYILIKVKY